MTDNLTDQGLAQLMASLGYPVPQSINQGRTIWSGRKSTILPSRTCSAFWGTTTMSSPEIRQIVHEVYSQHLSLPPDIPVDQREQFLDQEAARISRRVAELAADLGERSINDWQTRTGQHLDFVTKTGLLNTARASAMEIVLQEELYEQIPPPPEDPITADQPNPVIGQGCRGISAGREPRTAPNPTRRWRTWPRRYGRIRTSRCCFGSRPGICWRPEQRTANRCPASRAITWQPS